MFRFFCLTRTIDTGLGKVGKASLAQQTLMELFVSEVSNKSAIWKSDFLVGPIDESLESLPDISEWKGITFDDTDKVTKITWWFFGLKGKVRFEWLPLSLKTLWLSQNSLFSEIDFSCFPRNLIEINLACNSFFGRIDLTCLPRKVTNLSLRQNRLTGALDVSGLSDCLEAIHLDGNNFSGKIDFSLVPKSLKVLDLENNEDLTGDLVPWEGLDYCVRNTKVKVS